MTGKILCNQKHNTVLTNGFYCKQEKNIGVNQLEIKFSIIMERLVLLLVNETTTAVSIDILFSNQSSRL